MSRGRQGNWAGTELLCISDIQTERQLNDISARNQETPNQNLQYVSSGASSGNQNNYKFSTTDAEETAENSHV